LWGPSNSLNARSFARHIKPWAPGHCPVWGARLPATSCRLPSVSPHHRPRPVSENPLPPSAGCSFGTATRTGYSTLGFPCLTLRPKFFFPSSRFSPPPPRRHSFVLLSFASSRLSILSHSVFIFSSAPLTSPRLSFFALCTSLPFISPPLSRPFVFPGSILSGPLRVPLYCPPWSHLPSPSCLSCLVVPASLVSSSFHKSTCLASVLCALYSYFFFSYCPANTSSGTVLPSLRSLTLLSATSTLLLPV